LVDRRILSLLVVLGLVSSFIAAGRIPAAEALTNANVVVVGSSECDGNTRKGHLASKLELAGFTPSIMCISASSPAFGIDVARMGPPEASTVVLTSGLNVRAISIFDEPAQSELYVPAADADGYITEQGFRDSVRGTVKAFRAFGVERIIWFPIADNGHAWHDRFVTNNVILREEAAQLDFEVPAWEETVSPELFSGDGVHYTTEGYDLFADTVTGIVSGNVAPSTSVVGRCNYLTTVEDPSVGADLLGVTTSEFLEGNPHWNPYWRFGGIVCEPVDEVQHPLFEGTPVAVDADVLLGYSPESGDLTEFFLGVPSGGGVPSIIGPSDRQTSGMVGADTVVWASSGSLMLYSSETGQFRMMQRNPGGAWFTAQEMTGTTGWSHVIPGDYDGDGDADVLFYRARDGLMRFYSILPSGGFDPMTPAMFGTHGWTHLVAGDYDGDGSDDVYWYRARDGLMRFYEVLDGGSFSPISPAMFGTRNWTHITQGEYAGGGAELVFYRNDGVARFYEVDADRGFTSISPPLTVGQDYRQATSGDFDGGGTDDVFWYRSAGSVMSTLSGGVLDDLTGAVAVPQELIFTSIPAIP
jgi:hypothetical protein